jgi:toxin ParE1/3/4
MIRYGLRALRDLHEIKAYHDTVNPDASHRVLAAIKSKINLLDGFPLIGRVVDEYGTRRTLVGRFPYAIFYEINRDDVIVLHVRHMAREPYG